MFNTNKDTEWLREYSGKSVDELIVILRDKKAAELEREKQAQEERNKFFDDVLAHQYFRINHNHNSICYVRVLSTSPFQAEIISTFIQDERAEVRYEKKGPINPLWFFDKSPFPSGNTKVQKITKEDYERMVAMRESIHKQISERL